MDDDEVVIAVVLLEQALLQAQEDLFALDLATGRIGAVRIGIGEDGLDPGMSF